MVAEDSGEEPVITGANAFPSGFGRGGLSRFALAASPQVVARAEGKLNQVFIILFEVRLQPLDWHSFHDPPKIPHPTSRTMIFM